ncbi:LPXTG cell wall anchor domain-containing protein [Enterococcus crotali]|uniref:LPXTG cell wall anchor domain-containing protein n=1 Tax=Enterococcus crotali TaxID=1453587 RepID=UPI000472DA03|nr:LPXTG cell wall anchor domain-containing protein [Enterococcus crotali]OTP49901.1 hypothetical protein A5881_001316 [Enterococcus termitis]
MMLEDRERNKKEKLFVALFSVIICLSVLVRPVYSVHAENAETGGAVQTNGEIGFFEEKTSPSISDTANSGSILKPKPKGKFPSTGELMKKSLSFTGLVLLIIIAFFYLKKHLRSKEKGKQQ